MTELATVKEPAQGDVATLLRVATEQGPEGVALLERLAPLYQQERAESQRVAFYSSFRAVLEELPSVVKDADNTQTQSTYARLSAISKKIRPVYTKHGFSILFGEEDSPLDGCVRITGDIMHEAGHMTAKHVDIPMDGAGIKGNVNKTPTHAKGSTLQYGMRYLTCLVFTPELVDDDDDGNASSAPAIPQHLINHNLMVREWLQSILCIKDNLAEGGDVSAAAESYAEMPMKVLTDLNIATTKGGIWTTAERDQFKENKEFRDLVQDNRKDAGWHKDPENQI